MEMDELHDPEPVDLVASALVDGEPPPVARPAEDDPEVQRAVEELRAVSRRIGRVEAGDPAALSSALDEALGGSTAVGDDDPAPEVVDLGEHRRRRGLDLRRALAGAAAVVVLVAAGAGVLATLGTGQDELSSAGDAATAEVGGGSTSTDGGADPGGDVEAGAEAPVSGPSQTAGSDREDADPPALDASSGAGDDAAEAYGRARGEADWGEVASVEELRSLVADAPAAGYHANSAFEEAARAALRFDCPPGLLDEVEVLGRAVVAGWPVIVVRSADGAVDALKIATCEAMD